MNYIENFNDFALEIVLKMYKNNKYQVCIVPTIYTHIRDQQQKLTVTVQYYIVFVAHFVIIDQSSYFSWYLVKNEVI